MSTPKYHDLVTVAGDTVRVGMVMTGLCPAHHGSDKDFGGLHARVQFVDNAGVETQMCLDYTDITPLVRMDG